MAKKTKTPKTKPFDKTPLSDAVLKDLIDFTHNYLKKSNREAGFMLPKGFDSTELVQVACFKVLNGNRTLPESQSYFDLKNQLRTIIVSEIRNCWQNAKREVRKNEIRESKLLSMHLANERDLENKPLHIEMIKKFTDEIVKRNKLYELEVLDLKYDGLKNHEIAKALSISEKKVWRILARFPKIALKLFPLNKSKKNERRQEAV